MPLTSKNHSSETALKGIVSWETQNIILVEQNVSCYLNWHITETGGWFRIGLSNKCLLLLVISWYITIYKMFITWEAVPWSALMYIFPSFIHLFIHLFHKNSVNTVCWECKDIIDPPFVVLRVWVTLIFSFYF